MDDMASGGPRQTEDGKGTGFGFPFAQPRRASLETVEPPEFGPSDDPVVGMLRQLTANGRASFERRFPQWLQATVFDFPQLSPALLTPQSAAWLLVETMNNTCRALGIGPDSSDIDIVESLIRQYPRDLEEFDFRLFARATAPLPDAAVSDVSRLAEACRERMGEDGEVFQCAVLAASKRQYDRIHDILPFLDDASLMRSVLADEPDELAAVGSIHDFYHFARETAMFFLRREEHPVAFEAHEFFRRLARLAVVAAHVARARRRVSGAGA